MLRGDEGLDERVRRLRVEGQGVAERRQLGTLLQERLLQPVAPRVEVLLQRETERVSPCKHPEEQPEGLFHFV